MTITYTFPLDCPLAALRGVTVHGGKFRKAVIEGKLTDVCAFETLVDGKTVQARVAGKPELEAALATETAEKTAQAIKIRIALEAAVPGLSEYEKAVSTYQRAVAAYDKASEHGYPAKEAHAAVIADEALQEIYKRHPETALWHEIELFSMASNYEKSAAAADAQKRVLTGAPIADVVADMRARWAAAAQRLVDNS